MNLMTVMLAHPWVLAFTFFASLLVYKILFSKRPEPPMVEVGKATVTVTFGDDYPDYTREFVGTASWAKDLGTMAYTAASAAVRFINSERPINVGDGNYIPRYRACHYHMNATDHQVRAERY